MATKPQTRSTSFPRIRRRLLAWYERHKRDLPWRRRRDDAYAQLLAEFMLQQTQVATVIPYFERFMARFPTIQALAAAPRDDVLALWSGLGYYSRARNLHEAARQIVERFGGRVPDSIEALISLPGVGRYTAGAIASVAYDRRAPILDGNVIRVLARLFAITDDTSDLRTRARLWELAEAILPRRRCGDFNQALMELGATVCSPQAPQCLLCPLRDDCIAQREALTDCIPRKERRPRVQAVEVVVAAIARGQELLFAQRPEDGLWGGLWELPTEPLGPGEGHRAARRRLLERIPLPCRLDAKPLPAVTRTLTHRRMTFHTYRGRTDAPASAPLPATFRWLAPHELACIGLSRACQSILQQIEFA